jgi:hypothetical protein
VDEDLGWTFVLPSCRVVVLSLRPLTLGNG